LGDCRETLKSASLASSHFLTALLMFLCFSSCRANCTVSLMNPVQQVVTGLWIVDPFIIPPKGRCNQTPVDSAGNYLPMNFDAFPNITARCDDRIKFVMRTIGRQQRHGVYLTKLGGNVTAGSQFPCPPPLVTTDQKCQVRLNETDIKDTQCPGYTQLYPLLMFGPNNAIVKEYTTATLRTLVAPGKNSDTLIFSCPWVQVGPTSHCLNGMFLRVSVEGCSSAVSAAAFASVLSLISPFLLLGLFSYLF
jgi:hypothetical protein